MSYHYHMFNYKDILNEVYMLRYIVSIFWAVLISAVISYVLASMADEPFSIAGSLLLAAIFAIGIITLGEGGLKEDKQ
ncbi:MAG TPA: DUF2929 family protein [Virgibacillus sp.]|nr:DUF2929 family protein [Virgibacillus sp.]